MEATGPEADFGRVMISEITVPGVPPGRTTTLPQPVGPNDAVALRLDPPRRACLDVGLGPVCDAATARRGEDDGRLDRTLELSDSGAWRLSGTVVAVPGPASAALLDPVDGRAEVRSGSVLGDEPAVSARFAYDENAATTWLTAPRVARATLRLRWPGGAAVTGISVVPGSRRRPRASRCCAPASNAGSSRWSTCRRWSPSWRLDACGSRSAGRPGPRGSRWPSARSGSRGWRAWPRLPSLTHRPAPCAGSARRSRSTASSTTPRFGGPSTTCGSDGRWRGRCATDPCASTPVRTGSWWTRRSSSNR